MKFSKLSLISMSLAFVLGGCAKNNGNSSSKSMSQGVPSSSQQTTSTPTPSSSSTSSIQPEDHELIGKKYLFNG